LGRGVEGWDFTPYQIYASFTSFTNFIVIKKIINIKKSKIFNLKSHAAVLILVSRTVYRGAKGWAFTPYHFYTPLTPLYGGIKLR
jgi:hypothetical protein